MGNDLTIFTIPKSFADGHIAMIQRNAISSWLELEPRPHVVLCGDEPGIRDTANELGCEHVGQLRLSLGVPIVSDVFNRIQGVNPDTVLLYVNADILLFQGIVRAIDLVSIHFGRFMLVGQRWHWDTPSPIEFSPGWQDRLDERLRAFPNGHLDPSVAIDYFGFRSGTIVGMPDFAIGHYCWDTWLIAYAINAGLSLVNGTAVIRAIHQDHRQHRHARLGGLADRNRKILEDKKVVAGTTDMAPWTITEEWEIEPR